MMKKGSCLVILSLLLACLGLVGSALPVSAASKHEVSFAIKHVQEAPSYTWRRGHGYHSRAWWWHVSHEYSAPREINQFRSGNSDFNNPIHSVGHDIGNTGNSGHNRGRNEDNDTSDGNQIITPSRLGRFRRVNQYNSGNSNFNNPVSHFGYDQANNGNSGINDGLNQDNSSNGGNQIIG